MAFGNRWRPVGLAGGALLLACLLVVVRDRPGETRVYRKAALRAVAGQQFYRPKDHPAFTYPPFFVLAYMPLAHLPPYAGRVGWYLLNFALLALIARRLVAITDPLFTSRQDQANSALFAEPHRSSSWSSGRLLAWVLVTVLASRFIISPIEYQSHDLIVLWFSVLAIDSWGRSAAGASGAWPGWWAGLAAACKATPLLFVVPLAMQRRWSAVVVMIAALTGATLLPDLLLTNPAGELWVRTWHRRFVSKVELSGPADAKHVWNRWNMLNQSLSGSIHRLTTRVETPTQFRWDASLWPLNDLQQRRVTLAAQVLILLAVAFAAQPRWLRGTSAAEARFRVLGQGSAVLCAMLLLSPMSSKQHFCALIVPLVFLVTDVVTRRRGWFSIFTLLLVLLLGTCGGKDICGQWLQMRLAGLGSLTWCTLACLIACGAVLRDRSRSGELRQAHHLVGRTPLLNSAAGKRPITRRQGTGRGAERTRRQKIRTN